MRQNQQGYIRWISRWPLLVYVCMLVSIGTGACNILPPTPMVTPLLRTATPSQTPRPLPSATALSLATITASGFEQPQSQPQASFTPTPCPDAMSLVLSLHPSGGEPDSSIVIQAGSSIRSGWRIKNIGACVWDTSYSLHFSDADNPGWVNLSTLPHLQRSVKPGESLDLWVEAMAPLNSGSQMASWELRDGRGKRVGEPLLLTFETAGLPTVMVTDSRWFGVYPESIQPGERAVLSWNVQDAKAIFLYGPGAGDPRYPVETKASRYVFPQRTSRYQLHIVNSDDTVEDISVTVIVESLLAPRIRKFEIKEPARASACVQIEWVTENRVNRVLIYRNGEVIWDGLLDDGEIRDCPPPGSVVYIIEVYGPGGMATKTKIVRVP